MREQFTKELKQLTEMQKMWALKKPSLNAHILSLQEKIPMLEWVINEIVTVTERP